MKQGKSPRKSWTFYMIAVMIVTLSLNALVFPAMSNLRIIEVGYNTFRQMTEQGRVKEVEIGDN